MTTQYLQKPTQTAVLDECSSWIERILVRAAETIAAVRNVRARQTKLGNLGKLSPRQLSDIGLDDPQVQIRLFDAHIESESESLDSLRNHFQVRR
jgi:uncharacterized protein YjiS (DUF1127 family)